MRGYAVPDKLTRQPTFMGAMTAVLLLLFAPSVLAAGYDVSYLWHRQLTSVQKYQLKVGRVLGPGVATKLRIVQKPGLYGLIYYRQGSSNGATAAARKHTRLLRARGLDGAAPVKSVRWNFVGDPVKPRVSTKATVKKAAAAPPPAVSTPAPKPATPVRPTAVSASTRRELEKAVEAHVKNLRRQGKISADERTAWSVYDFTSGEKLVDINEDVQFQAASLAKPFFALAFFHKSKYNKLNYGPRTRHHMRRMIQQSNNPSTNWIMRRVGGPRVIQSLLRKHYPGIFKDTRIVEYIPRGGRTYRNKASVHDYSRFLYALWKETIPGAREIKRLMALPGPDRLYTGAASVPKGTRVYNKTGSTARLCGDMGILVVKDRSGKDYAYSLVGVIEKRNRARNYSSWIRSRGNVIRAVSSLVYKGISNYHQLRG